MTVTVLAMLAIAAGWLLLATPTGDAVRHDPTRLATDVRRLVAARPLAAPVAFLAVYLALSVLCLPIWWLQVLAGIGFGFWSGGGLCLTGSAIGATLTAALADWLAGQWFHDRIESHVARLRWLDDTLGHHGLLTVLTLRLTHLVPFGVGNVLLGLSRVSAWAVMAGTLIGNVPAVAVYVGLGAGLRPRQNWPIMVAIVAINVGLLSPLGVKLWQARRIPGRQDRPV